MGKNRDRVGVADDIARAKSDALLAWTQAKERASLVAVLKGKWDIIIRESLAIRGTHNIIGDPYDQV